MPRTAPEFTTPTRFDRIALREARKAAGMGVMDVAIAARVSYDQVKMFEFGRTLPRLDILCRLVDAIGIEIGDLFVKVDPAENGQVS